MKKINLIITIIAAGLILTALSGCGGKVNLAKMTYPELYERGKTQFDKKKYDNASLAFQTLVYNFPGETVIDTAQYYLALSYFSSKEYELAQVEFNRLAVNYPSSVYFDHALFMKAVCYYEGTPKHSGLDQNDLLTALKLFENFKIDYPESELQSDAQAYIDKSNNRLAKKYYESGVVYEKIRAFDAAVIYFQKVIDDFTNSKYAADATYKLALVKYNKKEYNDAENSFKTFIKVFPDNEYSTTARELSAKAAFKYAESVFEKKDMTLAKEKFEYFKNEYSDHKLIKKADKYLQIISITPLPENESEENNS